MQSGRMQRISQWQFSLLYSLFCGISQRTLCYKAHCAVFRGAKTMPFSLTISTQTFNNCREQRTIVPLRLPNCSLRELGPQQRACTTIWVRYFSRLTLMLNRMAHLRNGCLNLASCLLDAFSSPILIPSKFPGISPSRDRIGYICNRLMKLEFRTNCAQSPMEVNVSK